ncbi:Transglutaminase-like superfamily protein [Sporobacter termitidis DSM 10068]|uniref:Transglutaminase-like superfamily protein n=1 Tax=Sporobacter termitidis DSM 10068 TaxID=1123282 RepID=A0A1M5VF45_9FIRM|nr:transglutaminase-like domain-containing protein [Sporobacter termitidis]SHH73879.1 Transglutaminase-like superfamily protein [Sporobacter termitidis DSM 10068]
MDFFGSINIITVVLIGLVAVPVLIGVVSPFSSYRMQRLLGSLLNSLIFLASIILSVYLTTHFLYDTQSPLLTKLFKVIPSFYSLVTSRDIWSFVIVAAILTALLSGLLYLLTMPVYRFVIVPLTDKISSAMGRMNGVVRRILGGIWELPKAAILVVICALLLNFYVSYNGNSTLEKSIDASGAYQYIDKTILDPLLSSQWAQKIPVLLGDSFKQAAESLEARNIHLIRYFNGMTLGDAVKSNADIDAKAKSIVGKETDQKAKAKLLYTWVAKNIDYDSKKAAAVAADSSRVASGAVVAYDTRTGICFDYSCLYVAMCRAVDVKVRFVTGLGYSGTEWGDHAWNQVYDPAGNRWINVDTTFGSSGRSYFDRAGFDADHQYAVVQGEW